MDKKFTIGVIILTLTIMGIGIFAVGGSTPPTISASQNAKISIDSNTYDFGTVSRNDNKVTKTFILKSTGTDALKLSNIKTSCHCTTVTVDIETIQSPEFGMNSQSSWVGSIASNKEARVHVIFDQAYHGQAGVGAVTRIVYIDTNDAANKQIQLLLTGTVR